MSFVLLLGLCSTALGTTYYVSPSGNDGAAGTSPSEAWATIDKVNSVTFSAGDSILFEGGETFSGGLVFTSGGTPTSPITVSSYGTGRATISSGTERGVYVENCAGFNITDLIFVGSGREDPGGSDGLYFNALHNTGPQFEYIRIDNLDVSRYRYAGIDFVATADTASEDYGFNDVQVTNCYIHDIGNNGINCEGYWPRPANVFAHSNFYIADCTLFNISGWPSRNSGNGIRFSNLDGALIEFCEAIACGWACQNTGGGPVGIWHWEANDVTIQFCEAHHCDTYYKDGGGFDHDGGASNSTIQYCYSHDNAGAGYLIVNFQQSNAFVNNTVRYCISENDGLKNGYGPFTFWAGAPIQDTKLYNNTVYVTSDCTGGGLEVWTAVSNTSVHNNIFISDADANIFDFDNTSGGWMIQGNCYWASGSPLKLIWAGTTYTSLADFRSGTGQEMLGGQPVGIEADPQIIDAGGIDESYKIKITSPMIDTGLDIQSVFGIDPGPNDYFGTSIPQDANYDIGAHERVSGSTDPGPDTTAPAAPSGLTATAVSSHEIDLDWADSAESDLSNYILYSATSPGGPYTK
jgi:hypothetical protein